MNRMVTLLLLMCGICSLPVHGIFYKASVFQFFDRKRVILLSDDHRACENATIAVQQRSDVLKYAQWKKARVIAEDSTDFSVDQLLRAVNGNNNEEIENIVQSFNAEFEQIKDTTPLGGLAQRCRTKNIACTNVEFRYLRELWFYGFKQSNRALLDYVTSHMIMKEVEDVEKEVRGYAAVATGQFDRWYQRVLRNYGKSKQKASEIMRSSTYKKQVIEAVEMFDHHLIDARIVHAIDRCPESHIIVCAGGKHIDAVCELLQNCGFTQEHSVEAQKTIIKKTVNKQEIEMLTAASAIHLSPFFKEIDSGWNMLHWFKKIALVGVAAGFGYFLYKLFRK